MPWVAKTRRIGGGCADYVLALKNHLYCEDVRLWLDAEVAHGRLTVTETVDKNHGRIEIRRYALNDRIDGFGGETGLSGTATRRSGGVHSDHRRPRQWHVINGNVVIFYACYGPSAVGHHGPWPWAIEDARIGCWMDNLARVPVGSPGPLAQNLALMRRMALNVLRHHSPARDSIRRRKTPSHPQRRLSVASVKVV